jgi:hypothetical protein
MTPEMTSEEIKTLISLALILLTPLALVLAFILRRELRQLAGMSFADWGSVMIPAFKVTGLLIATLSIVVVSFIVASNITSSARSVVLRWQ